MARLEKIHALPLTGILLLATGGAMATSIRFPGWKVPLMVFLGVVGAAAIAVPLVRNWYANQQTRDTEQPFSWTIPVAIVAALVVVLVYGESRQKVVTLLLISGAATVIGVLIGFLFGIPRVAVRPAATAPGDGEGSTPALETNTNLEHISDWLTKIIVGVSLVQADEIVMRFDSMLDELARMQLPKPLMGGITLFFLISGFLNGYLWTRLILTRYFFMNERALREKPEYYEGLMNAYLYQPKPKSFSKVIELFEQYTRRFGAPRHSRIWVYAACAWGQKYYWARKAEGKAIGAPELQPIVDKTVEAIRAAIATDPGALTLLRSTTREGFDDDLQLIAHESPDVQQALATNT